MLVQEIKLKSENASPKSFSILNDQALSSAKFFNFETYSEALARIIQNPNTDTPLVVGIFGDWGSGKTSLMKTIETRIKNLFFVDDINDPEGIILKLKETDNPLSEHVQNLFSSKFMVQLFQYIYMESGPPSEALKTSLVDEFNAILKKPCIFDKESFRNIELTQETKKMVKKNPVSEEDCIYVNRRLLEESYPKEILLLGTSDLKDPEGLAMLIQNSDIFMSKFPEKTKQLLEERRGTQVSPELKKALADGLNTVLIDDHDLLESEISNGEMQQEIQKETHSDSKPLIAEHIRSNRLVLEKIFPHEIVKGSKNVSEQCSIKTIWFNAWKYDKEDALWRALLMRILEDLKVPEIPKSEPVKKSFLARTTDILGKPMKKYLSKPLFSLDDTIDPKYITLKLWDDQNYMSRHLIGESEKLQELLKEDDVFGPPLDNIHKIMDEVNTLLKLKPFDFSVPSYMEVSERSKKELHGKDLIRFNRKILEEYFWDKNQNKQIEALQASLYKDVYHEEVGDLEFQPKKAFKGTVKLGLSALPLIGDTTKTLLKK